MKEWRGADVKVYRLTDDYNQSWICYRAGLEAAVALQALPPYGGRVLRITHFMNEFRTMGLIEYNWELVIRTELLTDLILHH
jgi:hypothetical protein